MRQAWVMMPARGCRQLSIVSLTRWWWRWNVSTAVHCNVGELCRRRLCGAELKPKPEIWCRCYLLFLYLLFRGAFHGFACGWSVHLSSLVNTILYQNKLQGEDWCSEQIFLRLCQHLCPRRRGGSINLFSSPCFCLESYRDIELLPRVHACTGIVHYFDW